MMRPMLDQPSEPVNDLTYFDCLDTVLERSRSLGDAMTGIANHAKRSEHEQFGESVREVSTTICSLVESSAQAAYLVGASDASSTAGRPGLVDLSHFARASQAIQMACQQLSNPASSQPQRGFSFRGCLADLVGSDSNSEAPSSLCNACRVASSKTTNPVAKRHFVQSAKDVASATASLVKEIKVLDQDPNEVNRQRCGEATRPLIEAVDSLTTFASSPELCWACVCMCVQARAAQEPITAAGRAIIDGSCSMILSAKSLVLNPKDPPAWQSLGSHSKEVSDGIKRLVSSIKDKSPGQKECDEAIDRLNAAIRELDRASLSILNLPGPDGDERLRDFGRHRATSLCRQGRGGELGHTVSQAVGYLDPLVQSCIAGASHTLHSKRQMALLDQTKTVAEGMLQLVYASKQAAGNPKAVHAHGDVDEAADNTRDALQELLRTLESAATEAGVVTGLVESVSKAMYRLEERSYITIGGLRTSGSFGGGVVEPELSYVDYQTRMVRSAKEVSRVAQDMVAHAGHDPSRLTPLAADLSHHYASLAGDARGAMATSTSVEVPGRIRTGVQDLGKACINLTKSAGACQGNPGDSYTQRELAENARHVSEKARAPSSPFAPPLRPHSTEGAETLLWVEGKERSNCTFCSNLVCVLCEVSHILAALQAGSRGTQACINAASTVSGIIGDLDTTIMFATAGTLHSEREGDQFVDHRSGEHPEDGQGPGGGHQDAGGGAASSQEQLAVAAQNAVSTIVQLAEAVKLGAASLGAHNPDAQVMLVNAVKDVASALGDLVQATKAASGKGIDHPAMAHLKESAKVAAYYSGEMGNTLGPRWETRGMDLDAGVISGHGSCFFGGGSEREEREIPAGGKTARFKLRTVEDEHARGTRALESTVEAISQEAFDSSEPPLRQASPEDLVRATQPVTLATAKAVAAGNSGQQNDIIVAANMGRKAIFDLLSVTKSASCLAETQELRTRVLNSGRECAVRYRELLQFCWRYGQRLRLLHRYLVEVGADVYKYDPNGFLQVVHKPTAEGKQTLVFTSRNIAVSVSEIVAAAEALKGTDWADPNDPTVIAETELLGAAASIEAAARKLANLQPRRSVKVGLVCFVSTSVQQHWLNSFK
ncbi:hypothetical protein HPB48_012344 [Haemaphysalis longicornis]|uniref:Talin n=1 Tax=Haemaphysalis longicornis TaxID=44386 RepID=A0A9J6G4A9_HAELO|nr:hypothetical protein HPB48_012344 [Haemaphysalis longicornis]